MDAMLPLGTRKRRTSRPVVASMVPATLAQWWLAFAITVCGAAGAQAQASPAAPSPAELAPASPPTSNTPPGSSKPSRAEAEAQCSAHLPSCDWLATLSSLERASVQRTLRARGLALDPAPWGKIIEQIDVAVEPIIVEGSSYLGFVNRLHIESKEHIVRREVLVVAGTPWDQARVEESGRRLRDPLFSSVAVLVPVRSADPSRVRVLVVTRDIWSFRFNTNYRYQNGKLTNLVLSLSEQNFLGRRKIIAGTFSMTQDQVALGPSYIDRNVLGKRWRFSGRANALFSRAPLIDEGEFISEGSESIFILEKPLWALASKWAWGASVEHRFSIERSYRGTDLRRYDAPETPEPDNLPWRYQQRRAESTAWVQRQLGSTFKHRFKMGYTLESQRPRVEADFMGSEIQRTAFERDVLPRSERNSLVFVGYSGFTPRYRTLHNIGTYDLAEDVQFGPQVAVAVAVAGKAYGSSSNFMRSSVDLSYTLPWCHDGYVLGNVGAFARLQQGSGFIDNTADASVRIFAPSNRYGRLAAIVALATRWGDTQNRFYTIGSENGLRGFRIGEFAGQRKAGLQFEARSKPLRISALRVGGVAFYDVGGAANTFREMTVHHNLGVGLRALIPQTSRELLRFELAIPLDGNLAGRPQFLAGFGSEF